jgi:hypothetical protein
MRFKEKFVEWENDEENNFKKVFWYSIYTYSLMCGSMFLGYKIVFEFWDSSFILMLIIMVMNILNTYKRVKELNVIETFALEED